MMSTLGNNVIRKIIRLGSSRAICLPRGFATNSRYVAIIVEGEKLVLKPVEVR
jgi:virulence-associated protein VagC